MCLRKLRLWEFQLSERAVTCQSMAHFLDLLPEDVLLLRFGGTVRISLQFCVLARVPLKDVDFSNIRYRRLRSDTVLDHFLGGPDSFYKLEGKEGRLPFYFRTWDSGRT